MQTTEKSAFKRFKKNFLFLTLPTLIFTFILLELVFRFVIPAQEAPDWYFDTTYQIIHFDNSGNTKGLYTVGKFAEERGAWSINNFGWNSPYNYTAKRSAKPRIAVIGDSFIEGFNVNDTSIYPFQLQKMLGDSAEVYAFGVSGAPFSQYLHMSRYVSHVFNPDIIIVNVVHNDFDESLVENRTMPFFKTLDVSKPDSTVEVPPAPYKLAWYKKFIKHSAIFRYIYLNLQFNFDKQPLFQDNNSKNYNANINVANANKLRPKIELAVNYICKKLREENTDRKVIVVIDGPRNNIYAGSATSNVSFLNDITKKYAGIHKLDFIDLTTVFRADYLKNKKKFNTDIDFHWNEYGHHIVADTLYKFLNNPQ